MAKPSQFLKEDKSTIAFSKHWISDSLSIILLLADYEKGWRHGYFGNYYIYDIKTSNTKQLTTTSSKSNAQETNEELGHGKVSLVKMDKTGMHIVY